MANPAETINNPEQGNVGSRVQHSRKRKQTSQQVQQAQAGDYG